MDHYLNTLQTKTLSKCGFWQFNLKTLRLQVLCTIFSWIIVSQLIHYLLNSISAVLMIIDYQSLSCKLLSFYSPSFTLPSKFVLAELEAFRKNHRPLAAVSWHWTAQYYVNTFRSQLMDTYALCLNWIVKILILIKVWFVDCSGSGPSTSSLTFWVREY